MIGVVRAAIGTIGIVILASVGTASAGGGGGDNFTVNSTASAGDGTCDATCTLRDAIGDANDMAGFQTIEFDNAVFTSASPGVIMVESALPEIDGSDGVDIRGGNAVILDGSQLDSGETGLQVSSGGQDVTITGIYALIVRGFPGNGVAVCGGALPECERDVSDLILNSITATDNGSDGIHVLGRMVGRTQVRGCRLEDNGRYGLYMASHANMTEIQTSSCDSNRNGSAGMFLESDGAIAEFIAEDVGVRDNGNLGLYLDSVEETIHPVIDTVTATGNGGPGVGGLGIGFSAAQPLSELVFVNSTVDGNGNPNGNGLGTEVLAYQITDATISGNSFSNNVASNPVGGVGLQIYSQFEMPSGLTISGNTVAGNVGNGIAVITDTLGKKQPDAGLISGNEISGNTGDGVFIHDSRRITISQNQISGNNLLGIDLQGGEPEKAPNDVTPNDPGDDDQGANDLLNFPELTGQAGDMVSGTACGGCKVQVFESDEDPSDHGEGARYIGEVTAGNDGTFSLEVCGVTAGEAVTATATDGEGNTSEFSENLAVTINTSLCKGQVLQGDVDCDGDVDSVDALKVLRHVASLAVAQTEPCDDIGTALARVGSAGMVTRVGDVDCDLDVDSVDALKILRHVASLPVAQAEPCRDIGT